MNTLTNCAEKKAKQFLNLLQGYTKGIRITAILILLLMGVSSAWAVNITSGTKLYLKPSANWNQDGARFAAYFFGNGEAWVSMTKKAACDGDIYEVTSPNNKSYPNVIFCRMNPSAATNNWDNKWNQTNDLTYDGSKNLYTVKEGTWDKGEGTWSIAKIKTNMTYTVTVPEGTEKCYIIGEWDGWKDFKEMASGAGNTFSISFESCSGYGYKYACAPSWGFQELNSDCNGTINDRTYSANDIVDCWSKKTIYVKVDHSDWKKNNERFAIYWWDNDSHDGWVDLEEIACNNYYKADIPLYGTSFCIVRLNGATSANNWDNNNAWNQTVDLNWTAAGDYNLYTINGKDNDKYNGTWSSSLLTINTNATGGNITVSPGETVNIGETITVTLNAQSGFVKGNATITIGNNSTETLVEGQAYTICGETTIDAEFIPSTPTPVYLKTTNWNADNAWFAIYWWKSAGNDGWVKMNPVDCNGDYYYGEVPAGTTHFIFVRLKPSTENGYNPSNNGLHWGNKWNQTGNLGLPNADANLFTPNATEGATATWSAYVAPTYSITINAGTGGNVSVSKSSNIALNEEVTVTVSTSEGYTYKSGTIAIGTNETTNIIEGSSNHTICGPTTITAQWTANQYDVTLDQQGGTDGTTSVQATYGSAMPAATMPTRTGYTFGGYYTSTNGSGTQYYKADGKSAKAWTETSVTKLYAKWTANQYTITWNANGGTVDPATSTYTYDGDQVVLPTPKRDGYTFNGWFTTSSGETKINDVGKENKPTNNVTYYAHWTENLFPVTISTSANGSVTPSGEKQIGIVGLSVRATANTGYQFENWTVTGGAKVADANSASTTVTATATGTVTANFTAITYTITYNLDGGTNHADNPATYTIETPTITLKDPTKTGYTFNGWYSKADFTNKVTEIATGSTGNKNLYAKWTENTVTISPTNAYDHGNPGYANPTASNSGKIGILSTSRLVAPSPAEGYTFAGWTLSDNIVVTTGNASSDRTITVRHKTGDGSAVSAVANYKENLDSHWHLVGDDGYVFPDEWGVSNNNKMQKRSGSAAEKVVYMTLHFSNLRTYQFKVVNDNGSNNNNDYTWYGYSSGNNFLEWTETSTKDVYTTTHEYNNDNNLKFTPNAVGDYEFKVDYSGDNPKVTITYPEVGSVSSYCLVGDWGNGWDATGIAFDAEGKVSLELKKRERPDYTFKVKASNGKHYTAADEHKRQFTRQHNIETISDDTDYPVDDPHNLQLQADATGTYIFEFDPATKQLKVTHPEREDGAYLVGDFSDGEAGTTDPDDSGQDWTEEHGEKFDSNDDCTHGVVEVCDWGEENVTLNFKIKINGIWYGFYHEEDAAPLSITTSGTYTLEDQYAYLSASNVQLTTNGQEGCYYFEYTLNDDGTLSVLIIFPNDRRTVTFDMQGHGTPVEEQRVLYNKTAVKPYVSDVDGYLFAGWYTDDACTKEYDFNTPVTKDITLYAKWIPYGDCVFFKNNLNWDEVYVYFYSSNKYWTDEKGTGANMLSEFPMSSGHRPHYRKFRGKMTQLGKTDIWYFDYISAAKQIDPTNWEQIKDHIDDNDNDINYSNIAFTAHEQYDHSFFDNTKVIRRGDFKPDMQLFIPQTDQTPTYLNNHDGVSTRYYNKGLWMIYNSTESGYNWSSNVGNWDNSKNYFTSEIAGGYSFTAEVELEEAGSTYDFKIHNQNGTWYGNPGTMTQDNCTNWWFKEEVNDNAQITPTVIGTYIFTAYLGDGKVMISLDYPLSTGDYRLAYLDTTANSFHPGHYLKKRNENKLDTVSFFIRHDKQPQVIAQRCTDIDAQGNATWETITSIEVNPAASITESGVYNFTLQQIAGQNDPQLLSETRPYTGEYYIRTDAAPGGWKSFRQEGNMMTYNSYADEHEDFDHYFCEWVSQEKGLKNVKYTVANDYSYCISDTLLKDVDPGHPQIVTDEGGDLPTDANGKLKDANVRWGWDSKTNKIRRAYMAGSGHKKDRFLVLKGNSSLLDINGNRFTGKTAEGQDRYNLTDDEVVFDDMGNWIYQMDVKANKETEIVLTALYDDKIQYFKGGSANGGELPLPLIVTTDDNTNYYKIRLIYDFKINQLIIAWLPEGEADSQELKVNMMIIRHNQEQAQQLNFKAGAQLTGIEKAYAVMTFDKYFLNNKNSQTGAALPQAEEKSDNERKFYWISFPFDVQLSDVSGFGEYGDYWIMEYYDGESRAREGYWAETETFWKYITNKNYTLKAGQGYVLYLNINKMKFESPVFANTSEVSLFFPSVSLPTVISGEPTAVDVPEHTCTIDRDNRNIYDSNWNLIGVPGFADIKDVIIGESSHKELNDELKANCVSFYYKYLPADNTYSATSNTETFQTMYAYMVQFAGTINWQTETEPAQLAARRIGSMPSQYDLRLELAQGEKTDQTFVQLKEADATAEFDMNVDMTKIFNSGMNIYTLTGSNTIQVAGNALPMEKATVPVGVRVDAAGEYTFRMPDGTDGIAVTLVDNATGTHTNMLMDEYTVTLDAGTIENRFYLVVDPDRTATSVENIGEEAKGDKAKGVEKFLIDGKLFIRTADGIFDAKGQRL